MLEKRGILCIKGMTLYKRGHYSRKYGTLAKFQKFSVLLKMAQSAVTWLKTHIAFSIFPILGTNHCLYRTKAVSATQEGLN